LDSYCRSDILLFMNHLLLVEDDKRLAEHIGTLLQKEGVILTHVADVTELEMVLSNSKTFQVIVLDRLLGRIDTKDRITEIKKKWPQTPVLILSTISTPIEKAQLINLGADDYLGKPFLAEEFLARVRALSRRQTGLAENYREIGDSVLDLTRRSISFGSKYETLPAKEFLLLKILTEQKGKVLNRNEILDCVWGNLSFAETNVVEATITNLRKRIENLGSKIEIKNMRNVGYWIEE